MNRRRISVIALDNREFPSLEAKMREAAGWVELAAEQGAQMVVLPECLNRYSGDGPRHPNLQTPGQSAFEDWREPTGPIIEQAVRHGMHVTVPVVRREGGHLRNSICLVDGSGACVWTYDKLSPTPSELEAGVVPGMPVYYDWEGVKTGGAICFDTCFGQNLDIQAEAGVSLILFCSLWPGGSQLNSFCKLNAVRLAAAYPAWSRIIDIDGREVIGGGYRQETLRFGFGAPVYTASLNFDRVSLFGNGNQERMGEILRQYGERVSISFDQENCLWFLDSNDPGLAEEDIMREFELISAKDYFTECARHVERAKA